MQQQQQFFSIIVAGYQNPSSSQPFTKQPYGIGMEGKLPWHIPEDMAYFKKITTTTCDPTKQNAVIMGRKTWDSLNRPLVNRLNIVISRQTPSELKLPENILCAPDFPTALELVGKVPNIENIFVIGGEQIYKQALFHPKCEKIYLTRIVSKHEIPVDTFFPPIDKNLFELEETYTSPYTSPPHATFPYTLYFPVYKRKDVISDEQQYLDLIHNIMTTGNKRMDRTGTGTLSIFGRTMKFNLRNNIFPLLTTKKVFFKGVAEELFWFIQGCTNAKVLHDKGVKIWDANGSREYLDSIGLKHREENDLGPIYGFNWRHFGAKYVDMYTDYKGQGIDQLANIIHTIKTNPTDRRMIMTAWNPVDLPLVALPPCHFCCQFYVNGKELSCQMNQRSVDCFLGLPFNIASYALLTRLIAQVCDLTAGDLIINMGDTHIYLNHVEQIKEQLTRTPRPFPILKINPNVKDIDSFQIEDLELIGYDPYPAITAKMAV